MQKIITVNTYGEICRCSNEQAWREFITSMAKGNTFCPAVKSVVFNLKTADVVAKKDENGKPITDAKGRVEREQVPLENPVLATTVMFMDGTKTTVVNSLADKVQTEQKEVRILAADPKTGKATMAKTGKFATVATDAAKEAGVVYAIVKRLFGKIGRVDKQGKIHEDEVVGDGFGRKLKDIVDMAYDTQYETAFRDAQKAQAHKEHTAREEAAKARKAARKPSFEENVATIAEALAKQAETKMA